MTYFRTYHQVDSGSGAGFDDDPISFAEAFGVNPDGSAYEAPEVDESDPTPLPEPPSPEPSAGDSGGSEPEPPATPPSEPQPEWAARFKTPEDIWKSYRELETKFSQRAPEQPQQPQQAEPPRVPIRPGDAPSEIKTEADLYGWASTDPKGAAMFAIEERDRLTEEQFNTVMNNWYAHSPFEAHQTWAAAQNQYLQERMDERQALQDAHYLHQVRDQGIEQAIKELPMLQEYAVELGEFIEKNPALNAMVEGGKTPEEIKNALHGIFYMMAGPKLATQVLEQKVSRQVADAEARQRAEEEAAAAAQRTQKAGSIRRNTAAPPTTPDAQDDAIREMILNPSGARR